MVCMVSESDRKRQGSSVMQVHKTPLSIESVSTCVTLCYQYQPSFEATLTTDQSEENFMLSTGVLTIL